MSHAGTEQPLEFSATLPRAHGPGLVWPRVVAIGGSTGLPAVLRGLRASLFSADIVGENVPPRDVLTAIVTVTDDGGSSGRLRRELGILPPGDVRNCLAALAPDNSLLAALFQHGLQGQTV